MCALQLKQTSAGAADKKLKLISRVVVVVLVRIEIIEQRNRDRHRLL